MARLFGTCVALGLALLYSRAAEARPVLEVSTTLGGADATEYLVRVANPEAHEETGVLELRRGDEHPVSRESFSVPAYETRYFRLPGDRGRQLAAVAVTDEGTFRAQERFVGSAGLSVFDIPWRDSQRLHDFRAHTNSNIVISHAVFDDRTQAPVLTKRAAVYDGIAIVMTPAARFASLPTDERDAILTWVRTGGTLALAGPNADKLDLVAGRLHPTELGSAAEIGLGRIYILPIDPWTVEVADDNALQEKLAKLVEQRPAVTHFFGEPWSDTPPPTLDPNRNYRSVMALAGILLVAQALVTAFAFRRLATKRGMGPAYRFVVGSSAVTFGAIVGLGIYAKGGFSPRAREVTFADVASGETVAWIERKRTYFASNTRSVEVTPRDAANDLLLRDSQAAVFRVNDNSVVLDDVTVQPWQTTAITERGTTMLGGGITLKNTEGALLVHNATGSTLHDVIIALNGTCLAVGDIENGGERTSGTPRPCDDLGPAWSDFDGAYPDRLGRYFPGRRLTLIGQLEEETGSLDGFRLEKRTTVVRVTGGDS